jgi:hypothetical protein
MENSAQSMEGDSLFRPPQEQDAVEGEEVSLIASSAVSDLQVIY